MMQFKRFMVFDLIEYYPAGGLHDCVAHSDDLDQAKAFACTLPSWQFSVEIFDRVQGVELEIVEQPILPELPYTKDELRPIPTDIAPAHMNAPELHLHVDLKRP